jgi:HD-like signal output (HDOD) protein
VTSLKLLFVDDELNILQALKRMLHPYRQQWSMTFCTSGEEALSHLQESSFDIIITDIRMANVDGSRVLFESYLYHPEMMRCVLSGYAERSQTLKVTGTAHQFLSKPCTRDAIENMVLRVQQLKDRLPQPEIRQAVSRLCAVPCRPSILRQLTKELELENPDPVVVADLVSADIGMSAKVLQLVTSSFFGRSTSVVCPREAVTLLGVELLAKLVNESGIFSPFLPNDESLDIDQLCERSLFAAEHVLADALNHDSQSKKTEYLANFLNGIGSIVLAQQFPALYRQFIQLSVHGPLSQRDAELQVFKTTAADVSSYLLSIWGFPQDVVDRISALKPSEQNFLTPTLAVEVKV